MSTATETLEVIGETVLIRPATPADALAVREVYAAATRVRAGRLGRAEDELSDALFAERLEEAAKGGLALVLESSGRVAGVVYVFSKNMRLFRHVLTDMTMAIHPDFQGKGLGKKLLSAFLDEIRQNRPDILRVELFCSEENLAAQALYESVGFKKEGRFESRLQPGNGGFFADIPMAWLR